MKIAIIGAGAIGGYVGHDEFHAAAADSREIRAAHDERDVLASQRKLHADVTANGSGTDDCYVHIMVL